MHRIFERNTPHAHGASPDERIATMMSYAPFAALYTLIALFTIFLGVAAFSYVVLVQPIMAALFAHPLEAMTHSILQQVVFLLLIAGSIVALLRQSTWLLMRTIGATRKRVKLIRGEFD